ncbi:hypothetical protein CDAR_592581 [Caerostris darwini]|uniref:Uncharacterized protein n=1 Tax=Caerostris darwini TaxID=1538125 RepID=A0AAV4QFI0_9ARAC|nr:hypothetical protein CDAR_592581 [Caerostris darwini]
MHHQTFFHDEYEEDITSSPSWQHVTKCPAAPEPERSLLATDSLTAGLPHPHSLTTSEGHRPLNKQIVKEGGNRIGRGEDGPVAIYCPNPPPAEGELSCSAEFAAREPPVMLIYISFSAIRPPPLLICPPFVLRCPWRWANLTNNPFARGHPQTEREPQVEMF